jgi:glucose dehydrogenase
VDFGVSRNLALYQDKVFLGTSDAHLVALDARSGKVAWDVAVADSRQGINTVEGYPISYAVDGTQYVAVSAGGGSVGQRHALPAFQNKLVMIGLTFDNR